MGGVAVFSTGPLKAFNIVSFPRGKIKPITEAMP